MRQGRIKLAAGSLVKETGDATSTLCQLTSRANDLEVKVFLERGGGKALKLAAEPSA